MLDFENPEYEKERIKYLNSYSILDTLPEEDYDNLTAIAAEICGTPISLVSLLDDKRQWFKSHYGLEVTETPKEHAFCAHAIQHPDAMFVVMDAREDIRFRDNPLVTGEPHVVFYAGMPLRDEQNLPLGTLCVIDHEPRQLSENQIHSLKALSSQVMNLLKLRKKKKELEQALSDLEMKNKELEKFAFVAAHDIKSPLNHISALAGILSKVHAPRLDDDGNKMILLIQHAVDKLKSLVDGVLKYSRAVNVLKEEQSTIRLDSLMKELKELFIADNTCSIRLNSTLKEVKTNKTALEQILINLVSNAIKYSDKETTKIEIGVATDHAAYEFYVKDNGPGIPKDQHEAVFDIFKVIAPKDKFGNVGNGIGLATVKKLVEALEGNIRLESTPGEGTKFIFTISKD